MDQQTAKKLADHFSEHGQHQLLAAVFRDQVMLYAQVTEVTAANIAEVINKKFNLLVPSCDPVLSTDGLTYCFLYERNRLSKRKPKGEDWLNAVMVNLAHYMGRVCPELMEDGSLPYIDNRYKDHNTVEAYASLIS